MLIYLQAIESEPDKLKFEELYLKYRKFMRYIAMKILRDEHDAEDAVHQAFIYIAKNISKISEIECPKTRSYIAIIIEHVSIDMMRARKKTAEINFDDTACGVECSFPADGSLTNAVLKLPARYREALFLRFYHGYEIKEIAKMWNMKYDAAQKLIVRAKDALAKELEKEGEKI